MAVRSPSVLPGRVRGSFLVLTILGMALAPIATAAQATDEPLPETTRNELARKVRAARESYTSGLLEVEYEDHEDDNALGAPLIVKLPGKFRYVSDGLRWRIDNDAMTWGFMRSRNLVPDRWTSGFDGAERFTWYRVLNLIILGDTKPGENAYSARELFWYRGDSLLDALESPSPATTIGQRTADGVRCYQVVTKEGDSSTETLISPRHGFLPIRRASYRGEVMDTTYILRDLREAAPGVWAPGQIFSLSRTAPPGDAKQTLLRRRLSRIVRFEPGVLRSPPPFRVEPAWGVDVTDLRLGYPYHNDPWWPEISKLLRDRFDRPKAYLWPLGSRGSLSHSWPTGKPAPPIRGSCWLNSQALGWNDLRGKVTLVAFWNMASKPRGEQMAALRRLQESYHPAGFEIIAVHAPTDDVEELRRFAREYRLPFPIVVDEKEGALGATATSYGLTASQALVLVDHTGVVHPLAAPLEPKAIVGAVVGLLRKAGAPDVLPISDDSTVSEEIKRTVVDEFRRLAFNAPATGRIHGTVRDGNRAAIAGAKVEATLQLILTLDDHPGSRYPISGRRHVATTGPDGQFDLTGLCKGTYALRYTTEGKAGFRETAWIGPDLQPVTADAVLAQGDAIEGTVRDELGRGLAGVVIQARTRRYPARDGTVGFEATTTGAVVVTDAEGRFRFDKLMAGDHLLELAARGFAQQSLWIPAGSLDVKAVLKHSLR